MRKIAADIKKVVIIPGNDQETLRFAIEDWVNTAIQSIQAQGYFAVALSGGSTPKAIYQGLTHYKNSFDWSKVLLFWSDERACAKDDINSNYRMAMESGLGSLPILEKNIFPMDGLGDLEANAKAYERLIEEHIPSNSFDLMMLGMGDDGHTASLFPKTHGLHSGKRQVIANFIPEKDTWRLSVAFDCINHSKKTAVYILGKSKAEMVQRIFSKPEVIDELPIQNVGTIERPAFFILDDKAAEMAFNGNVS